MVNWRMNYGKMGIDKIFIVIVFLLGMSVGILCTISLIEEPERDDYIKKLDGYFIQNKENKSEARKYGKINDPYGDWVCTNIRGMNFDDCVRIATHECAHEVFAEACERDDDLCKKVQEMLNENTKHNQSKKDIR